MRLLDSLPLCLAALPHLQVCLLESLPLCLAALPHLQVCLLESRIQRLVEMLSTVINDTRSRIEKKQGQTYEELQVCTGCGLRLGSGEAGVLSRMK